MAVKRKCNGDVNTPNSLRRLVLHAGWVTPVITSTVLPAHAVTSFLCMVSWSDTSELVLVNGESGGISRTVTITNTGSFPLTYISSDFSLNAPLSGSLIFSLAVIFPPVLLPGVMVTRTLIEVTGATPTSTQSTVTATFNFEEASCEASFDVDNQFLG